MFYFRFILKLCSGTIVAHLFRGGGFPRARQQTLASEEASYKNWPALLWDEKEF